MTGVGNYRDCKTQTAFDCFFSTAGFSSPKDNAPTIIFATGIAMPVNLFVLRYLRFEQILSQCGCTIDKAYISVNLSPLVSGEDLRIKVFNSFRDGVFNDFLEGGLPLQGQKI